MAAGGLQDPRSGEKVDKQLWVTRKGATSAQKGQYGIIPGSMGVGSFITKAILPLLSAMHSRACVSRSSCSASPQLRKFRSMA